MRRLCRLLVPLATLALLLSPLPATVQAGVPSSARPACRGRIVCDHSLGVMLTQPAGWIQLLPPKVPRHEIDLARLMQGPGYDLRLIIRSLGATTDRNDRRASAAAANRLIRSERATHVRRTPVRYGGTPGLLLRGLPPTTGPAADIVLAHAGALYLIIAPGMNLAPDQRAALASLRFIPRVGRFPPAPM